MNTTDAKKIEALETEVRTLKEQLSEREEWITRFTAHMDIMCGAFYRCTSLEAFEQGGGK